MTDRAGTGARLLALDTATEQMVAGLATPQGRWLRHEAGGAQSSARLLPLLLDLLREGGQPLAGLDAIAFGVGPGAFTGLRTACAVAQGLGYGAGRPLLAIDSLLMVAEAARASQPARVADAVADPWWVAVDARMDEVYAAEYAHGADGWQTVTAPALYTLDALAARWLQSAPRRVAGNAPQIFGARLPVAPAMCTAADDPAARAAALLTLAEAAWAAGRALPADQALPLYLRDKVALTTEERLRAAAVASPGQP